MAELAPFSPPAYGREQQSKELPALTADRFYSLLKASLKYI